MIISSLFCIGGFGFLGAIAFAYPILDPAIRAAKGRKVKRRFFVIDFLWLLLVLQVPLAYVASVANVRFQPMMPWQLTGTLLLLFAIYVWWRAAVVMSTLGIEGFARRGIFISLVAPIAIIGAFPAVVFCCVVVVGGVFGENVSVWLILLILIVPVLVIVLRWLCRWVVAGAEPPPAVKEDDKQP